MTKTFLVPMPIVLVGANVDGKANFQTTAFIGYCNYEPIIVGIGINPKHYTAKGIMQNGSFSINIPSDNLVVETDYCGLKTGRQVNKAQLFNIFYGDLKTAPMISECPVTMECEVIFQHDFEGDTGYFGKVVAIYADDEVMVKGIPDLEKIRPFLFSMPDNRYWLIGKPFAKAYQIGKELE